MQARNRKRAKNGFLREQELQSDDEAGGFTITGSNHAGSSPTTSSSVSRPVVRARTAPSGEWLDLPDIAAEFDTTLLYIGPGTKKGANIVKHATATCSHQKSWHNRGELKRHLLSCVNKKAPSQLQLTRQARLKRPYEKHTADMLWVDLTAIRGIPFSTSEDSRLRDLLTYTKHTDWLPPSRKTVRNYTVQRAGQLLDWCSEQFTVSREGILLSSREYRHVACILAAR